MFQSTTIIRELVLNLAKVTFMLLLLYHFEIYQYSVHCHFTGYY